MTLAELHRLVRSITYQPGWTLFEDAFPRTLHWRYEGKDNFGRYPQITVEFQPFVIPETDDEAAAVQMIFLQLAYGEDHHLRERFRVAGKAVYNPHKHGSEISISHGTATAGIYAAGDRLRY